MHHHIISMLPPLTSAFLILFTEMPKEKTLTWYGKDNSRRVCILLLLKLHSSDQVLRLQEKTSVTKASFCDLLTKYYLLSKYCILSHYIFNNTKNTL